MRPKFETVCDPEKSLTLLEPESRFGDKPFKFQVVCPQNGTAVLKKSFKTKVDAFYDRGTAFISAEKKMFFL